MKPLIVANWKMNPQTQKEAEKLFILTEKSAKKTKKAEVVVCPSFIFMPRIKNEESGIMIGAQDVFWEESGAYTGEISAVMLKDIGCQYVILGHSERRKYFGETDGSVNKKIKAVIERGLKPILCIGETEEQRKNNETENVLKNQLESALNGVQAPIVVAYEPIWAIGTGNACSKEDAKKANLFIKEVLFSVFSKKAENIRILYGGSVNSKNSADYLKEAGFNGLLVGGASLDEKEFSKIIESAF